VPSNLEQTLRAARSSGRQSLWEKLEFWRAFSAVGVLAVLVLSAYLGHLITTPPSALTIAPNCK